MNIFLDRSRQSTLWTKPETSFLKSWAYSGFGLFKRSYKRRVSLSFKLSCILFPILPSAAFGAEKPWLEVDSPHFRVLSNGSDHEARRIALEFEQMRATLVDRFPHGRIETGTPLITFAARDEETAMELAPWMRQSEKKGIYFAGYFQHHWEKQFALVRLDLDTPDNHQVVYHEYTHNVLHANFRWLPMWFDEGLAEFFANTRFESGKIYIGAPSPRYRVLQNRALIPLDKLISMRSYRDGDEAGMFYAESWALVHFLHFGPGMAGGQKLNEFEMQLQKGTEQKKAFEAVFGDLSAFDKAFNEYVHRFAFTAGVLNNPPAIDEKSFQSRRLSAAETNAQLGGYHLWSNRLDIARPLIEESLMDDPNLGLANENLGFLQFTEGKDQEAQAAFSKAYALDPNLYLSLYYKTMLSDIARSREASDLASFRDAMLSILKINPDFAPAYIELALLDLRQGDTSMALAAALKAEKSEPTRAGYHLLTGNILLRLGRGKEASDFARYVASRWTGSDHNEAAELWNLVPLAERITGEPVSVEGPKDAQRAEGEIRSVACGDKDHALEMTIDRGGESLTFRSPKGFMSGFSDTIWYGADHFSACHHLAGIRAIVWYKPSTDKSFTGDIVEVEYRNDIPNAAESAARNSSQNSQ